MKIPQYEQAIRAWVEGGQEKRTWMLEHLQSWTREDKKDLTILVN